MTPDYKLGTLIGRGSFGSVYKSTKLSLNTTVAIKVLDIDTHEDDIKAIQNELALLAKCVSPYITRYLF
jgi:serine/threonine protein kinase